MQKLNISHDNSHHTARFRTHLSAPVQSLHIAKLLKGKVLDFGCGRGSDADILTSTYLYPSVQKYDPFYFPQKPSGRFDTVLCIYVLTVVEEAQQRQIIEEIQHLLTPIGKAYIAVRTRFGKTAYYARNVQLDLPVIINNHDKRYKIYQLTK